MSAKAASQNGLNPTELRALTDDIKAKVRSAGSMSVRDVIDQWKLTDDIYLHVERELASGPEFVVGPQFSSGRVFRGIRHVPQAAPPPAPPAPAAPPPQVVPPVQTQLSAPPPPAQTPLAPPPPPAPLAHLEEPLVSPPAPVVDASPSPSSHLSLATPPSQSPPRSTLTPEVPSQRETIDLFSTPSKEAIRPESANEEAAPAPAFRFTFQSENPKPREAPAISAPPPQAAQPSAQTTPSFVEPLATVDLVVPFSSQASISVARERQAEAEPVRQQASEARVIPPRIPVLEGDAELARRRLVDLLGESGLHEACDAMGLSSLHQLAKIWVGGGLKAEPASLLATLLVVHLGQDLLTSRPLRERIAQRVQEPGGDALDALRTLPLEFCRVAGFPSSFAPLSWSSLAPSAVTVRSPYPSKRLAPHQEEIYRRVAGWYHTGQRKLLISQPAGSGKTSAVVRAVADWMTHQARPQMLIWVAERDELAEQAHLEFEQAWTERAGRPALRLLKLWGQHLEGYLRSGDDLRAILTQRDIILVASLPRLQADLGTLNDTDFQRTMGECACVVFDDLNRQSEVEIQRLMDRMTLRGLGTRLMALTSEPIQNQGLRSDPRFDAFDRQVFEGSISAQSGAEELRAKGFRAKVRSQILEIQHPRMLPGEIRRRLGLAGSGVGSTAVESELSQVLDSDLRRQRLIAKVGDIIESQPNARIGYVGVNGPDAQQMAVLLRSHGIRSTCVTRDSSEGVRSAVLQSARPSRPSQVNLPADPAQMPLSQSWQVLCHDGSILGSLNDFSLSHLLIAKPVLNDETYAMLCSAGLRGPAWNGRESLELVNCLDLFAGERLPVPLAFERFLESLGLPVPRPAPEARAGGATGIDDVVEYLLDAAIPYIDRRPVGGRLWIPKQTESDLAVAELQRRGVQLTLVEEGHAATRGKAAWYLG